MDSKAVAEILGVHRATVRGLVRDGVLTPSGRVGNSYLFNADDVMLIKESLYRDGLTHTEIAKKYGKSRNTVIYWFRAMGVEPIGRDRRQRRGPAIYDRGEVRRVIEELNWKPVRNGE